MVYIKTNYLLTISALLLSLSLSAQIEPDNATFTKHIQQDAGNYILSNTSGDSNLDIVHTLMDYSLDPNERAISGTVTHQFRVKSATQSIVLSFTDDLDITEIATTPPGAVYTHEDYNLEVDFPETLTPGVAYSVSITYSGTPPANGYYLQEYHNDIPVLATFAEPWGASDWWPCNTGLTDKVDSLDIILTFPSLYSSGANGLLVGDRINDDNTRTQHWRHRYPVIPYNIAFAISEYEMYSDTIASGQTVFTVDNLVWPEDVTLAKNTTAALPEVFELLGNYFGEYPFSDEKYGHMQWPRGGAMEHQTMTSTCCWNYELLVHELGHQWFGNMVTLNSWHDIFLNEGFATYISGLAYESLFPEKDYWERWKSEKREHIITQPGGSVYVQDTTDIDRIFDARLSYNKGAMVLHMLRKTIGDTAFFTGVNNYLYEAAHHYGFASMDSFINSMEVAADTSLTEFFNDWYYGEGYPTYTINYTPGCSALFSVILSQETSHESVDFFEMPVALHLKSSYADTIVVFNNTYNNQYFLVPLEFCVEEVLFDPEISLVAGPPVFITGIEEQQAANNITISPNPVINNAIIEWNDLIINEIIIYSTQMKPVGEYRALSDKKHLTIDKTLFNSGLHFIVFQNEDFRIVKKMIIM